jgi:hypothetical protein
VNDDSHLSDTIGCLILEGLLSWVAIGGLVFLAAPVITSVLR